MLSWWHVTGNNNQCLHQAGLRLTKCLFPCSMLQWMHSSSNRLRQPMTIWMQAAAAAGAPEARRFTGCTRSSDSSMALMRRCQRRRRRRRPGAGSWASLLGKLPARTAAGTAEAAAGAVGHRPPLQSGSTGLFWRVTRAAVTTRSSSRSLMALAAAAAALG